MEIKIGEKYKSIYDDEAVEIVAGPDSTGRYCAENEDGDYLLLKVCEIKPLRTAEEGELDKLCEILVTTGSLQNIAKHILENYVSKDDPRVVEPVSWDDFIGTVDTFDWLIDNKHICVKDD